MLLNRTIRLLLPIFILINFSSFFIFAQNYTPEAGYVDHFSTAKGDTVKFYISTSKNPFTLSIYKVEDDDNLVTKINSIKGGIQAVRDSSYYYGCRWKLTLSFVIPVSWKPGAYRAVFPTTDGTAGIIFFVTEKQLGTYSKILFVSSTNTWNAYNYYGGKSLYGFNSKNGNAAIKVSYLRPNWYPYGSLDFYNYEREAIRWLARNKIYPEFTTDTELHFRQDVLQHYDVVFIVGHSEYWTSQHRWQFQNYLKSGGRIIILAGATCWSQVRFEGDKMVSYHGSSNDPLYGKIDSLVTNIFNQPPVNWPENPLTGVSGEFGGYVNHNGNYDDSEGFSDYAAFNTQHWVFKNTFLREGEEYGFDEHIVGDEDDGTIYKWTNGIPVATGSNGTPLNFRLLSISPADHYRHTIQGWATMGIFVRPNGGAVFNASSIRWAFGLSNNRYVQQITKNVLDKFLNKSYPPDIVSWSPAVVDSATINKKLMYLNKRDFFVTGKSLKQTFTITAEDPSGSKINYFWTLNGKAFKNGSILNINNSNIFTNSKKFTVTGYAFNEKDTSSITWNYFNTQLAFTSEPVTKAMPNSQYLYRLNAFNFYNDKLTYHIIQKPSWLTLDKFNTLVGKAPSVNGTYSVSIRVINNHNQVDTLNYKIKVAPETVPVELTSFTAVISSNNILLNWKTATEINNLGFELERSTNPLPGGDERGVLVEGMWTKISFIKGNGSTTESKSYSYTDRNLSPGNYSYRLKQIDLDGSFAYSNTIEADVLSPYKFELSQNYPNPFNPSTIIDYTVPGNNSEIQHVILKLYDILGKEVVTLVDEFKNSGSYSVVFNSNSVAGGLASGIYFYRLSAGNFNAVKKMTLLR